MRPFVTCLCVTRNRPQWLQHAVEYFRRQTFTDAELLIVADGDEVKGLNDKKIRVVNLRSRPGTLGEKRNLGCDIALGYVVAIWDDDDYHAPHRLEDQMVTMETMGRQVVAYNKMKFTDGHDWWLYDGVLPSVGIGGSLCFTQKFWIGHKFPELNEAEDNALIRDAWRAREFVAMPACDEKVAARLEETDFMVATVHAGNTSTRDTRPGGNYAHIGTSGRPGGLVDAFSAAERGLTRPGDLAWLRGLSGDSRLNALPDNV